MNVANPFQSAAPGRHIVQSPKDDSLCVLGSAQLDSAADTLKGIVHKPHTRSLALSAASHFEWPPGKAEVLE